MNLQERETPSEAVRNLIARHPAGLTRAELCARFAGRYSVRLVTALAASLLTGGELTETPAGRLLLGRVPVAAAEELTLVSADPCFGQPSLF